MLDNQIVRRHNRFRSGPLATGQDMSESGLPLADQLQDRVRVVQGKWAMLMKEAAKKSLALEFECNVVVISKEKSDVPMSVTGEKTDPFLAMLPRDQVGIDEVEKDCIESGAGRKYQKLHCEERSEHIEITHKSVIMQVDGNDDAIE